MSAQPTLSGVAVCAVGLLCCWRPCEAQQTPATPDAPATPGAAGAREVSGAPGDAPPAPPSASLKPAGSSFIPVPELDVDPVSGLTYGVIGVLLHTDDRNEIERIVAPA